MAENPGKSFFTMEVCSKCGSQPAVFLHYVWHKGQILHICTACVLNLHRGDFCPICFTVYDSEFNPPNDCIKCSNCEVHCHLTCISSNSSFFSIVPTTLASSSSSSSSEPAQDFSVFCSFCTNPNVKILNFGWDEGSRKMLIDKHLASQIFAAAVISHRSMKKASKMASVRAEILCKEAVEARKKAKEALQKLHDLTSAPQDKSIESKQVRDSEFEHHLFKDDSNDDDDDDEEEEDDEDADDAADI